MRSLRTVEMAAPLREHLDIQAFEEVLACNIKDVIADFCLTDAEIIRFYADNQLHGNMDDMMTSSAELYFKGETLSYGYVAHVSTEREDSSMCRSRHGIRTRFHHSLLPAHFRQLLYRRQDQRSSLGCDDSMDPSSILSPSRSILSSARLRPLPRRFKSSYCLAASRPPLSAWWTQPRSDAA